MTEAKELSPEAMRALGTMPAATSESVVSTQIAMPGLWYRCRDFITEQSAGEWSDKDIADDTDKLFTFVSLEVAKLAVPEIVNALRECADELEGYVEHQYANTKDYPSEMRRYQRDIAPVTAARAALAKVG